MESYESDAESEDFTRDFSEENSSDSDLQLEDVQIPDLLSSASSLSAMATGQKKRQQSRTSQAEKTVTNNRGVTVRTVEKWKRDFEKCLQTSLWLDYVKMDREYVAMLKCKVCIRFSDKIQSCRNYNAAFINGSKNLRSSAVKDHGKTDMHQTAMRLYNKYQAENVTEYSPLARALYTLDASTKRTLEKKFNLAYFICKENMAFTKMAPLCELQAQHGVQLGTGYKNNQACSVFVEYIAKEQRIMLREQLKMAKFFSIQADGSTDCANKEEELFLVLYFDPYSDDGKVHVRSKFFAVRQPKNGTAAGLYESYTRAFDHMEVIDWENKLIGFGCDGTSVNIAGNGLKGLLERSVPWVVTFWCLAHRLELSIKDALKSTYFSTIDEVLLRVYYLYKNSTKKCRELEEVIQSLKSCFIESESEMHVTRGNRPLRACGTRFIAHKVAAINRLLDKYGAYIAHLCTLIEDPSVKQADKSKLKGYVLKWKDSMILFGCSFFHDLLKPCAILSKVLQDNELCVTDAIEALLKTKKNIQKLRATSFEDLPTVKKVMSRIQDTDNGTTYQGVQLTRYTEAVAYFRGHMDGLIDSVLHCFKDRVKDHHADLLTDVLTLLATHGWSRSEEADFASVSVSTLASRFTVPLERAGIDVSALGDEWIDMVDYAKRYLNITQENGVTIWWKLFNSPSSKNWVNILSLIELVYCLPMSNGHVERIFSTLKLIKTERRSSLCEDYLDNILRIMVDGPPLSEWNPSKAVQLWWNDKQRRSVSDTRKAPKKNADDDAPPSSSQSESVLNLEEWEHLVESDDSTD